MCEGHYDILTEEGRRGDTVFIPAEGPELDALVDRMGVVAMHAFHTPGASFNDVARAAIEALRGK